MGGYDDLHHVWQWAALQKRMTSDWGYENVSLLYNIICHVDHGCLVESALPSDPS